MGCIIERKDETSISCPQPVISKYVYCRKIIWFVELIVAVLTLLAGMSIMLLASGGML